MNKITFSTFFSKYAINPLSEDLSKEDQRLALISSIAVGVFSLGTVHLTIWSVQKLRKEFWEDRTASQQAKAQVLSTEEVKKIDPPLEAPPVASPAVKVILPSLDEVVSSTPAFKSYQIQLPKDDPCHGMILTGASIRPANMFFSALFKGSNIKTTLPGSRELFAFNTPHDEVRKFVKEKALNDRAGFITFSASEFSGNVIVSPSWHQIKVKDFSQIFGNSTYKISYKEIEDILDSQRIYLSTFLPLPFYRGLKEAFVQDGVVELPNCSIAELKEEDHFSKTKAFVTLVSEDPLKYGFRSVEYFNTFQSLSLYQVGSMVVKSEDYHIFMDGDGKILAREPGEKDAIRLINACGIRNISSKKVNQNTQIMTECFKTALTAATSGFVLFPAVGMGVWRGDPGVYWKAFLDAVIASNDSFDAIYVNPGHQKTFSGAFAGRGGDEFQTFLDLYSSRYKEDPAALAKLGKIKNLFDTKQDLVQLAYNIKKAFPDKTVSLFNASDPDVTLGNHVGEYTNNQPHTHTTEENYTAMGTNGLCFEGITGVHEDPSRIISPTL